ncbi:hypothetical protein, partial [Promicromonospora kroppenstedtii]|uniref:hypothetical protein n=1 Tax=Promicromonospora kroppenstedtii TaxID=440482 RepID=UPI00146FA12B
MLVIARLEANPDRLTRRVLERVRQTFLDHSCDDGAEAQEASGCARTAELDVGTGPAGIPHEHVEVRPERHGRSLVGQAGPQGLDGRPEARHGIGDLSTGEPDRRPRGVGG